MSLQHDYPVAPAQLFAVLVDPDYLKMRHERFGGVGIPEVENAGDLITIRTVRQLPMDKVPGAFRGFLGNGQIEQIDTWSKSSAEPITAEWRANAGSAPATIGGEHLIQSEGDGSRYTVTVNVKINIPLVGGKFTDQVSGYLNHVIDKELTFLDEWVADH